MKYVFLLMASLSLSHCGWRAIPQAKNAVEATMSEVNNQYKRRTDLIPNLVATVKGFASHEKETLTAVVEARSKASQMTLDPTQLDAQKLQKFQQAQGQLSQALGRLMVIVERYPELKADRNFRELQAQLEGTENRITIARQRLIESIQNFNNMVTVPPQSWTNSLVYRFEKMPQWDVSEEEKSKVQTPPQVEF